MAAKRSTPATLEFIRQLKQSIYDSGLKPAEVAARAGISRAHLSRLLSGERGVPTVGTIARLEEALDIQPRGALFDAAGLHDSVVSKVLKKNHGRVLLRALAPLTDDEMGIVLRVTEGFARHHSRRE
jgi:transcriptional regulator with XRE-family HTH domain